MKWRLRRFWHWLRKSHTVIVITGLTEPQKIALEDMLRTWESLGSMGASRWTAFYADGDGNFHPHIIINGRKPRKTPLLTKADVWNNAGEYRIDYDQIAWRLRERRAAERNRDA